MFDSSLIRVDELAIDKRFVSLVLSIGQFVDHGACVINVPCVDGNIHTLITPRIRGSAFTANCIKV